MVLGGIVVLAFLFTPPHQLPYGHTMGIWWREDVLSFLYWAPAEIRANTRDQRQRRAARLRFRTDRRPPPPAVPGSRRGIKEDRVAILNQLCVLRMSAESPEDAPRIASLPRRARAVRLQTFTV